MPTSVELKAQQRAVLARLREINEQAEAEGRDLTAEENTNYEATKAEWVALRGRIERAEYLESTPAADEEQRVWNVQRDRDAGPPQSEEDAQARAARAYEQAFRDYLSAQSVKMITPETWSALYQGRRPFGGEEQSALARILSPEQYRAAMSVGSQTGGGFWVPDAMMQRVEAAMLWFGGIRQFAEVITTDDGADLPWPVYNDTSNTGRRLAENTAATQTDLEVGMRVLKAHMYSSDEVLVSYQLMQDRPDLASSILADALGERVGRIQNTEFTTYAAADGPQGIVPIVASGVTAAAATEVTPDELRQLKFSVNRAYRDHPSSAYMMADATVGEILGLKDGNGQYIFTQPTSGEDPTIWGKRVIVNDDVPATATGNKAVLFGKGASFKVRQVRGFTLLRLDERYAPSLQVSFLGFARADSGYINAGTDPIKCITMA